MKLREKDLRKILEPTDARTLRQQDSHAEAYRARRAALTDLHELKPDSFIFELKDSLPGALCDEIIAAFEQHKDLQAPGKVGGSVNPDIKRSVDITLDDNALHHPQWRRIDKQLIKQIRKDTKRLWDLFPDFLRLNLELNCFQIQKTHPGVLGFNWHDDGGYGANHERQWAIIWYLNDVPEGGTTEFLYYDADIKPERGKLALFPCTWLHIHRAVPPGSDKYIITSFFTRSMR